MKSAPILLALLGSAAASHGALVAYWNFNGLSNSTNNGTAYAPTSGTGSLDLAGWNTTATSGITSFGGTTANAISPDPAGQSLALQGGPTGGTVSNNGGTMVLGLNLTDLDNPVLTIATQRTGTGFNSNQVAYSTDGTNYTNFEAAYLPASTFGLQSFDFSAVNGLDGDSSVFIKITFSGATGITGNNRIDNIQVNAIPEPAAALLGSLGLLSLLRRRR